LLQDGSGELEWEEFNKLILRMQRNERFAKRERRRKWEERHAMRLDMEGLPEPEVVSESEDEEGGQGAFSKLLGNQHAPHLRLQIVAGTPLPPPVQMGGGMKFESDQKGVCSAVRLV